MRPTSFHQTLLLLISGLSLIPLAGCGGSSALEFTRAQVSGTVIFNGKPLEQGLIRFIPDGKIINGQVAGKPIFAKIENGTYQIPAEKGATVGKNRVEVTSYQENGGQGNLSEGNAKLVNQIIPARYNSHSTLTAEIKEGNNTRDFDLN